MCGVGGLQIGFSADGASSLYDWQSSRPNKQTPASGRRTQMRNKAMFTKVAAALIAVTMFSAPVLAKSAAPTSPAPATQPVKAKPAVKHVMKITKHKAHAKVSRHRTHIKHVRHAKSAKFAHTARIAAAA
jgi:hypothetical protein